MFLITKTQQMYETTIDNRIKVISASAIVSLVVAVLITAIALCQLKQIKNQIQYNLELFTFFPSPSIRAFIGKLEDFDMKISDEKDLTSEIGIEK